MSKSFIYCFSEEEKKELILNGFKYICQTNFGTKKAFVFHDDCKKLNFTIDKTKYLVDDKMYF